MEQVQLWLAALFTICIYSMVLYKDNKLFRFAEIVMVSITAANEIVLTFHNYIKPAVTVDIVRDKKVWLLIPIILGLFMYSRFFRSIEWLARFPMAFFLGVGAAYVLTKTPAIFFTQIQATFLSLNTINNILFVIGVITVVVYFFFTVPREGTFIKGASETGRIFLLIAFGASFGNTVMSRISVLLGRLQFLLRDFLKIA